MKYLMVLGLFVALINCNKAVLSEDQYVTKEALLSNQLPVDGCDWHFSVSIGNEFGQYIANKASQSKVDQIIQSIKAVDQNGLYSAKVSLTFKLTGIKRKVLCGFNRTTEMDEIDISEIKVI